MRCGKSCCQASLFCDFIRRLLGYPSTCRIGTERDCRCGIRTGTCSPVHGAYPTTSPFLQGRATVPGTACRRAEFGCVRAGCVSGYALTSVVVIAVTERPSLKERAGPG